MTAFLRTVAVFAAAALAPWAAAQTAGFGGTPPPDPDALVSWAAGPEPVRVAPGETATLRLGLTVEPGWHVYALDSPTGIPLSVDLGALPAGVRVRAIRQSNPIETVDPSVGEPVRWFEGTAVVEVDLDAAARAAPGEHAATVAIRFGVCDDRICLPPQTRSLPVRLVVAPAIPAAPEPAAPTDPAPEAEDAVPDAAAPDPSSALADPDLTPRHPAPPTRETPPTDETDAAPWLLGLALAAALAALLVWRRRRPTLPSS